MSATPLVRDKGALVAVGEQIKAFCDLQNLHFVFPLSKHLFDFVIEGFAELDPEDRVLELFDLSGRWLVGVGVSASWRERDDVKLVVGDLFDEVDVGGNAD
jgi:hypothetical protein